MSNVWFTLPRATLSVCARQPLRPQSTIRAFATQQWKLYASREGSSDHGGIRNRATAAVRDQVRSPETFRSGQRDSARHNEQSVKRRRPNVHAKEATREDGPVGGVNEPRHYSLPGQPYEQAQIDQIFGKESGVDSRQGNYILAVLHERRLAGSIAEEGISEPAQAGFWSRAAAAEGLQWLRLQHPVDEEATTAQWAEEEARRIESEIYTQRGVSLGLFKPSDDTNSKQSAGSPYAGGVLDSMTQEIKRQRTVNEKKRAEAEEREEQERLKVQERLLLERRRQTKRDGAAAAKSASSTDRRFTSSRPAAGREVQETYIGMEGLEEWGARKNESQYSRKYRQQIAKDALREPPKMTKTMRLLPSSLVAAFTIACCFLLATYYEPWPTEYRFFPFISSAQATCAALIAVNVAVALAWKSPPLWRTMNKYFMVSPGYPYAIGMITNIFSHQSAMHLLPGMVTIWVVGTQVQEWLGSRGDFLALYVGAGVFGSWLSLTASVLRGTLYTYSLGASGAIAGMIAAGCFLAPDRTLRFRVPFTNIEFGAWTLVLLPILVSLDIFGLAFLRLSVDHVAHLGGYAAGTVGSLLLLRRYDDRRRDAEL